jgi:NADPH-dependent curcumin reductase CurA
VVGSGLVRMHDCDGGSSRTPGQGVPPHQSVWPPNLPKAGPSPDRESMQTLPPEAPPVTVRRFVLDSRPNGHVRESNFSIEEVPLGALEEGQVLLETLWISLDPAIRGWLDDRPSYLPPVAVGQTVRSVGIGRVLQSLTPDVEVGDLVRGFVNWSTHNVVTLDDSWEIIDGVEGISPLAYLGVLGVPGLTAWAGMKEIAQPRPGETVFVSGATGAVGSVAVQLAKAAGARVVAVAGGPRKTALLEERLGVDVAIDYRAEDWLQQLEQATPDGIDVNFENVGGAIMEAVIDRLNNHARMVLCGLIDGYNMEQRPAGPRNFGFLLTKRIKMEGLIVFDHLHRIDEFRHDIKSMLATGQLEVLETVEEGFDQLPKTFVESFGGDHIGKLVVKV